MKSLSSGHVSVSFRRLALAHLDTTDAPECHRERTKPSEGRCGPCAAILKQTRDSVNAVNETLETWGGLGVVRFSTVGCAI